MRLVILVLLASCWRGGDAVTEPQPSFEQREQALRELRRRVEALAPKLEYVLQRIVGLSSEVERTAIRDDLARLDRELAALADYAADARTRGDDPAALDVIQRKLEHATLALAQLHDELRYAKTAEERDALRALPKTQDDEWQGQIRRALIGRRLNAIRFGVERVELPQQPLEIPAGPPPPSAP